jgi:hypothetical protein
MKFSTIEPAGKRGARLRCRHCGHVSGWAGLRQALETGLGALAVFSVILIFIPLAILVWKSCLHIPSTDESRSILFRSPEDWMPY